MRFHRNVAWAVIASVVTAQAPAWGEATPVQKGEPAPYGGVLLTPQDAARVMADKQAVPDLIAAEVKRVQEEVDAKCKLRLDSAATSAKQDAAVMQTQVEAAVNANKALAAQLDAAHDAAKWTPLWVGLSAVGGTVAGVLVTSFVNKIGR